MDFPDSCRISVPGSTQVSDERRSVFAYRAITFYGWLSHTILLTSRFVQLSYARPYNPTMASHGGLGFSHFARHYFGNDLFSSGYLDVSVPQVPLVHPMCSDGDVVGLQRRVSPFGNPRVDACSRLFEAYRSDPRPSSALGAKASAVNP